MNSQNARNTDPESSHLAGEQVTLSGERQKQVYMVARMVEATPKRTSDELAYIHSKDRYMVARRLPDCTTVKKGKARKCEISGRQAVTWVVA